MAICTNGRILLPQLYSLQMPAAEEVTQVNINILQAKVLLYEPYYDGQGKYGTSEEGFRIYRVVGVRTLS